MLARHYFSAAEATIIENLAGVDRLRAFYRLWSLKEAALKSIGKGLPFGLDAFSFELHPGARLTTVPVAYGWPEEFSVCEFDRAETGAALVARSRVRSSFGKNLSSVPVPDGLPFEVGQGAPQPLYGPEAEAP